MNITAHLQVMYNTRTQHSINKCWVLTEEVIRVGQEEGVECEEE